MANVRVLGISSSPRASGNTAILVEECLRGAESIGEVETRYLSLRGKRISPCIACDKCNTDGVYCVLRDKMADVYDALIWSNAMVLGTPVYMQTLNAQMKAMLDRCRPIGRKLGNKLRFKIGGAIAVGAGRNHGQEYALSAIQDFFNIEGMASIGGFNGSTGLSGVALAPGRVLDDYVQSELYGNNSTMDNAFQYGRLLAACARAMVTGTGVFNPDQFIEG